MIDGIEQPDQTGGTVPGSVFGEESTTFNILPPSVDFDTLRRKFAQPVQLEASFIPPPNAPPDVDADAFRIVNSSRNAMQASLMNATQYSPDDAAEAQRLGAPMNLNYDLVLRNKDQVKHAAIMRDIASRDLMRNDPILARQLENLDFAAIAYDDIDNLSTTERLFRDVGALGGGRPWDATFIPVELVRGYMTGRASIERGLLGERMAIEGRSPELDAQAKDLKDQMTALAALGKPGILAGTAEMIAQNLENVPEMAAGGLIGMAVGGPPLAAAGVGIATFATVGKMEAGNLYMDMYEAGVPDDEAIPAALAGGLLNGAIEVAGLKIAASPFKTLAKNVIRNKVASALVRPTTRAALASAGRAYLTQVGGEALEESLQEVVGIAAEELARAQAGMDPGTTWNEGVDRVVDAFIAGGYGSAIVGGIGPGLNVYADLSRANTAIKQSQFFDGLNRNAPAAKVKARNVGAYEQFLAAQARGTAAETIYVDGTVAQGILRQSGITPQQLDAVVPGLYDRVREAAAAGGDVQIPTAQYGARMAGTELGTALTPHLRLAPDAMSAVEAQQFEAQKQTLIDDAKRILEEKKTTETAFVDDAVAFENRILSQIEEAGKTLETPLTKTQAQAAAKVYQAMYVNLAARAGKTVTQLEQEIGSPLQIRGAQAVAAPLEQAATLPQIDAQHSEAIKTGDIATAQALTDAAAERRMPDSQVRAVNGKIMRVFHGTQRIDRVGNRLLKKRATSGPMPFFTDTRPIAEGYAQGKEDTSIEDIGYEQWIKYRPKGSRSRVTLDQAWLYLTPEQRATATERLFTVGYQNPDQGTGPIVADTDTIASRDHVQYLLREARGNALTAAKELWLNSGSLFNDEQQFMDVLKGMGLTEGFVYDSPHAVNSGIIEAYINITNPLDTAAIPESVVEALQQRANRIRKPAAQYGRDAWDKEVREPQAWMQRLRNDIGEGLTQAWTSIPDWVTDVLRRLGYDGIKDTGGKFGGERHTVWIPFEPEQVKFADAITKDASGRLIPLSERFDLTSPMMFRQAQVPAAFYSALGRAIDGIDIKSASAAGWKERIKGLVNKGEIKQDELTWSGLEDWLSLPREGKITKEEVADFLKNNGVRVEQISPTQRKYAQYTLPGGTNYREVLLTLPVDTEQDRAAQETYNRLVSEGVPLMEAMERAEETLTKEFRSQHWTQPNVVAHLRMNDRVDVDGKRVLFVEEIQSDWAQAGRKKGFAQPLLKELPEGTLFFNKGEFEQVPTAAVVQLPRSIGGRSLFYGETIEEATQAALSATKPGTVALAPFVETTEGWLNLALKQVMLEAVNGGYDRVAFIDGQQSANRYDLSRQVDSIVYRQTDGGKYDIRALKGSSIMLTKESQSAEDLETTLGKDVAKKIIDGVGEQPEDYPAGYKELYGVDLKVGGEGMKSFYDKIVPAAANKLLKKYGGGKLGEIRLPYMLLEEMEADADRLGMTQADILEVAGEEDAYAKNQPGFDVTDALREKVASGLPLFQAGDQAARGGIDVTTLLITLGKSADITTFGHEAAHAYFEILGRLASAPNAPEFFRNDMDILLRFGKIAGDTPEARLATWDATPLDGRRKLHEAFAYNFEIYLFEGKSPSVEMQGLFDRFASWLKRVYRSLRDDLNAIYRREFGEDLPVLTGEVREVMDRMLASDEQIKRQREVQGMKPLLTGRPEGMSDADWAEYQLLSEQDLNAAIQQLTEASLKDMQWLSNARSRVIKSLQAQHAKVRKEMRERIATEVAAQPEYRTLKYLRTGMMQSVDGTEVQAEGVTKLNAARVDEIANATTLAQMFDTRSIPKGITVKDGQDPDVVAEMFGFPSGSDMILRISAAKPIKEAIDAQLDARMEAEYGEMFTPAEVEKQVNKALHNEVRARLVATELKWLSKSTQPIRVMLEAARQVARETIGRTTVGDLKPAQFIAAEARSAKEAAGLIETPMDAESAARSAYTRTYNRQKAAGATEEAAVASATAEATVAAARATERMAAFRERYGDGDRERVMVQAKRRQLLQNQLASAAIETQEEIDKAIKGFRKFFKADAKIAESRDLAMIMAARAILASRGIGRSDKAPAAYVEQLQANNPGLYAELAPIIMQAGAGDYRQMTVAEFRVLAESVEALWSRARRDRQIQVGEQKVELELVVSKMIAAMSKIKRPAVQPGVREAVGFKDVAKRQAMEVRAANRRVESWSEALDAGDPERPFTTYLWQLVKDAVVRFRQIRNDNVKKLYELVMQLDIPNNSIDAPELDYTFGRGNAGAGKAELLGAMLHTGNESNYRKLLLGRQWATLDEAGNMDDSRWKRFEARMFAQGVLTKGDIDFLQAVWDLNEEIKPLLQKAYYDLEGYYFKEVQARPVVTPFGTYRGGYVPAATDRFMVADAVQRAGMQELEQDWRFSLPSTGMGMTKARVESYTKPLALDVRLIVSHVDAALRFAIIQPAVVDALKILKNRSFAAEIDKIDPTAITAMLLPWLNRSAHQTVSQPGRFKSVDAFWRGVRTRTGMSIMFANLRNAFQQVTGLFPSALKVSPVYLKNATATYLGDPRGTANMIAATDPFMDQRMRDQVYEMQEQMNDLLLNPSKFDKVQAWNKQHAYFLQTAFQNQVDIITWLGAYNQSLAESGVGVSEEKARKQAIRDAGAAVRLTQGSILPEDISAFEAGTPFYRTFTQFAGYFNGIANLNATEMVKTVRTLGFRGGKGKLLYIYLLGFALPAIVSDAIVRSMGGGWEDDDEDGYLDVFMDWFFGSQIRMGAAFVPFGSTAYQLVTTPFDNKPYNDRMNNSPSIQAIESSTIGTGKAIVNLLDEDKELTGKNVRDVLTAITLATGIPVSVLGRPAGYLVDVYRGEIEPEGPIDFTMGLLTGTAAPSTRR